MEIGRTAQIDLAKENYALKSKEVSNIDEKEKVIEDEEYKKNLPIDPNSKLNEVMLDNIQFGYNKDSQDFFVKVTRGSIENKYPTEDMMKIKAFLLEELQRTLKN